LRKAPLRVARLRWELVEIISKAETIPVIQPARKPIDDAGFFSSSVVNRQAGPLRCSCARLRDRSGYRQERWKSGGRFGRHDGASHGAFAGANFHRQGNPSNLPNGNTSFWADKNVIKCLVQTLSHSRHFRANSNKLKSGRLTLTKKTPVLDETIAPQAQHIGCSRFCPSERSCTRAASPDSSLALATIFEFVAARRDRTWNVLRWRKPGFPALALEPPL